MIIPSIDIMNGRAVQLVQGKKQVLDAGDPIPIAEKFGLAGEIAVIDLDAALGRGSNKALIKKLCSIARCRVGGGIREQSMAIEYLDAGAEKVIIGTAATKEFLRELPRARVLAALDNWEGNVVVNGWQTKTGAKVSDKVCELDPFVGGFLLTSVECEGMLKGPNMQAALELTKLTDKRCTFAGGVTTADDIRQLDSLGADAQVGMALYTDRLSLADAIAATLTSDRADGLWPTVVTDELGIALGLCYSSLASLREAVRQKRGVYQSRSRGLWVKGGTSGATQDLKRIDVDCDRDALRFVVKQRGSGFCHNGTPSCWKSTNSIMALERVIAERLTNPPAGSYTKRLLEQPELLNQKLLEEADELVRAEGFAETKWEAADVIYFTMIKMAASGVTLADIEQELSCRAKSVTRRS